MVNILWGYEWWSFDTWLQNITWLIAYGTLSMWYTGVMVQFLLLWWCQNIGRTVEYDILAEFRRIYICQFLTGFFYPRGFSSIYVLLLFLMVYGLCI